MGNINLHLRELLRSPFYMEGAHLHLVAGPLSCHASGIPGLGIHT
jgi:hypothetical protein